jgi:chemotaxis protein methyltransferase CheR
VAHEPEGLEELDRIEMDLLLEAIHRRWGFDFRGYAAASLRRRLERRAREEGLTSFSALQERVLRERSCMDQLLTDLSISVTSMFRDPAFYRAFRAKVVPLLRTYPFVRIWNAGCSTGEETHSLAILLEEEGLYERTRIYATDVDHVVLDRARSGTYAVDKMPEYARNYLHAGGTASLDHYYTTEGSTARFSEHLRENIVFAQHNLASDGRFQDFHVITCRNVMIYFGRALQDRVHELFHASLEPFGILALGQKETIRFTSHEATYEALDRTHRIYRKVAP